MANILFLSNSIGQDNRDNLTYNFVLKEAVALHKSGHKVIHFHPFAENTELKGILFTGNKELKSVTKSEIIAFIFKHIKNYLQLLLTNAKEAFWLAKLEIAIGKVISTYHIDIAHTHFMYPRGVCAANICKTLNIPIVSSLRGAEVCNLPQYSYGALREVFFQKASLIGAQASSVITTPNSGMRKKAAQIFRIPEEKTKYAPNGVELNPLNERNAENTDDFPIQLIAIGRLIELKNHASILKALTNIDPTKVRLTIVGEGPVYEQLNTIIQENNLKNVTIIKEMSKEKLFQQILSSHYLIHPSISEGLPNVVLEALSLGKPCLVSKIDAHFDLIQEGSNGYFFDHQNPDNIANVISNVIENHPHNLTENCKNSIANFTVEKKIQQYNEIYEKLLTVE